MNKEASIETMWPEKIDIIYNQFPWIKPLVEKRWVRHAYVKKFDDTTLELHKISSLDGKKHLNHIWFVNNFGTITCEMGTYTQKRKKWGFWGKEVIKKYIGRDESVRSAIQKLNEEDDSTHLVFYDVLTFTIFKPPQKGLTIKQWYDARVLALKEEVVKQIEAT